jgi:hypothetical protein
MDGTSKAADGTCVPMSQIAVTPTKCGDCGGHDLAWFANMYSISGVGDGRLRMHEVQCQFVLGCMECSATVKVVSADDVAEAMTDLRALSRASQHPPTASKFVPFRVRLIHHERFQAGGTAFTLQAGTIVTVRQHDRANGKVLVDFGDCLVDWISQVTLQSCFNRVVDDE